MEKRDRNACIVLVIQLAYKANVSPNAIEVVPDVVPLVKNAIRWMSKKMLLAEKMGVNVCLVPLELVRMECAVMAVAITSVALKVVVTQKWNASNMISKKNQNAERPV